MGASPQSRGPTRRPPNGPCCGSASRHVSVENCRDHDTPVPLHAAPMKIPALPEQSAPTPKLFGSYTPPYRYSTPGP